MPQERESGNSAGDANAVINKAVQRGMNALVKDHPRFSESQEYLMKHLDQERLEQGVYRIQQEIYEQEDVSPEQASQMFYDAVSNYVASGAVFDDNARNVLLRGGLEEKTEDSSNTSWMARLLGKGNQSRELEGEKYFDQVTSAFGDVYTLMKSGDHSKRMPELAQSAGTLYDMGFLDNALEVLYTRGLINEGDYDTVKTSIRDRTKYESEKAGKLIGKYAMAQQAQKAAAGLLGIIGIGLIISTQQGITGNIIKNSLGNIGTGILGIVSLIISLVLFLKK